MNCQEAELFLNARIDGEISPADQALLDAHLDNCEACRQIAEEMLAEDAVLRDTFASRRLAADSIAAGAMLAIAGEAVDRVPAPIQEQVTSRSAAPVRTIRWASWARPFVAAAAGFALALLLFRPWSGPPSNPGTLNPNPPFALAQPVAGQLSLATGRVDVRAVGATEWFVCPTGGSINEGMEVRTGPKVRCEIRMTDGSEVRLNGETEVTVKSQRAVEVASGQVFSAVAKSPTGEQFVIHSPGADASMVALGTEFDVACATDSKQAKLTVVEGSVKVQSGGKEQVCKAGEAITVASGTFEDRRQVESLMNATQWVNEILVMKGRDNPELARRIDDLFAQIGQSKMGHLASQEVRRLGDHCVVPLTRYIQSDRSSGPTEQARRREAALIIGDVATTSSVPELINLLADGDGEVRYHAARALERLTSLTQGRSASQWRDQEWMTCTPTIAQWHQWWERNKTTLPGCDPNAVKPLQLVKEPVEPMKKG